jgi:hypothetical protein
MPKKMSDIVLDYDGRNPDAKSMLFLRPETVDQPLRHLQEQIMEITKGEVSEELNGSVPPFSFIST